MPRRKKTMSRVTAGEIDKMLKLKASGMSLNKISAETGRAIMTVRRAVKGFEPADKVASPTESIATQAAADYASYKPEVTVSKVTRHNDIRGCLDEIALKIGRQMLAETFNDFDRETA